MTYASEVLSDSPVLYWRLGESAGATTAVDASGNGRSGTYSFGSTLGVTGLLVGDSNTAASFDGVDDRLTYTGPLLTSATAVTYELWVKSTASSGRLISGGPTLAVSSGTLQLTFVPSGGGTIISSINVLDGNSHHVVVTYGSGSVKVYVDGSLFNSGTASGGFDASSLNIAGAGGGSNSWAGTLDEIAVYASTLSAARILTHYTAGAVGSLAVTPTFTAANTQTYAPEIVFGELDIAPGFTAATTQTFPPSVAAGAQRNITVTAAVERGRWHAAVIDPDRTAEVQPPRHRAGVTP